MKNVLSSAGVLAALLAISACGGSNKASTKKTTATTTTTPVTTPAKPKLTFGETVRAGQPGAAFSNSMSATPGQTIQLRTLIPGKINAPTTKVKLSLQKGPATTLTVTAKASGQSSSATIKTANGKPLTLAEVRYTCNLPPVPTFCPPSHAASTKADYKLTFSGNPKSPIFLTAVVGPTSLPTPKTRPSTSSVVPPYTPTVGVHVVQPGVKSKPSSPSATAKASPGQIAVLTARVSGTIVGAPQRVTFSFEQGPASSVTLAVKVEGGRTATATITSASGSKISLVLPRYTCSAPPSPSFCPALSTVAASHKYTLTFAMTPQTPAIAVLATVQAG